MADESVNLRRFPSSRFHLYGLATALLLILIFAQQPAAAAPLKTVSASPVDKTAVTTQAQTIPHIQLAPEFCGQTVSIMMLGNSIARGKGTGPDPAEANYNYGFRYYLYNSMNVANYNFDFVGTLSSGVLSGLTFDFDHEGYAGILAEDLATQVPSSLSATQPDVILLHIGTNDVAQRSNGDYAADVADVTDILNAIDAYSTEAIVILAQIIDQDRNASEYQTGAVATFNGLLATMAQERINAGDKLVLVDMYNALDYSLGGDMTHDEAYYPNDWLHPTDSGYQKMAVVWQNALTDLWQPCVVNLPFVVNP
ncbi:MAG: hypothetical protein KC434_18085 [Anaerolineales bacterium]|nr:hypothetical protein [Anaerolineales bacterium]